MKKLIITICILTAGVAEYAISIYPTVKVIKATKDENGLISVQFKYGTDTMAYDYLTVAEYKKFIKTGSPYTKN